MHIGNTALNSGGFPPYKDSASARASSLPLGKFSVLSGQSLCHASPSSNLS